MTAITWTPKPFEVEWPWGVTLSIPVTSTPNSTYETHPAASQNPAKLEFSCHPPVALSIKVRLRRATGGNGTTTAWHDVTVDAEQGYVTALVTPPSGSGGLRWEIAAIDTTGDPSQLGACIGAPPDPD